MIEVPQVSLGPAWDPHHPATRVYIGGYVYSLAAPRIPRPPLLNTVKLIANWVGPASRIAKNIFYALFPTGVDTTVPGFLQSVANQVMTSWQVSAYMSNTAPTWSLSSVTCVDNGSGSGAQSTSTHAPIVGTGSGDPIPPQCAVVLSWQISASYRGGKPRWYLPGLAANNLTPPGSSQFGVGVANAIETAAASFRTNFNASVISTFSPVLGTISYQTAHAPRPTPVFRPFQGVRVHERLDSQRRRSGKESSFGSVP